MKRPRWEYLHLDGASGYATAARRTMDALRRAGVDVVPVPFGAGPSWGHWFEPKVPLASDVDADVVVVHLMPEYFPLAAERRPGRFVIGHTAWETDRVPPEWPGWLDAVDRLVVPCEVNAQVIEASGTSTPVTVIPHPTAPSADGPGDLREDALLSDVLTFYVIAEWTVRKGLTETVRAFAAAFGARDQVQLVVKTTPQDRTRRGRPRHPFDVGTTPHALAAALGDVNDPPRVSLITRTLDDDDIAALHRRGHCYVSLTRGEGWGIGAFDAATRGTPVVTTGWGGHLDYLNGSPWLVGFDLEPVDHGPALGIDGQGQRWAAPDVEHAVELLRSVAADPGAAADARGQLAAAIHQRCAPEVVADRWLDLVSL